MSPVAAASGVSVDFLYRRPELRARIERLRGHQPALAGRAPASEPGNSGASGVVATLTARLTELRAQLAATEELIRARQAQHRQRTGAEMGPGHVWLTERNAELASLRAIIAALETGSCGGAVRGAGVPARPGQPVTVTISRKPGGHGDAR